MPAACTTGMAGPPCNGREGVDSGPGAACRWPGSPGPAALCESVQQSHHMLVWCVLEGGQGCYCQLRLGEGGVAGFGLPAGVPAQGGARVAVAILAQEE